MIFWQQEDLKNPIRLNLTQKYFQKDVILKKIKLV